MTIQNKAEKLRFGLIGLINTSLDFGVLFSLQHLGLQTVAANIVSTTVAFMLSFGLNKNVVFRARGSNMRREIILFVVTTLFGLWVLQTIVITAILQIVSESETTLLVSKILATIVTVFWNYVMYSRVVFKNNSLH